MTLDPRFDAKVEDDGTGCLIWTGYRLRFGYGVLNRRGRTILAHRYAYVLAYGPIPDGAHICHTCDRPECVNPAHLFAGDRSTNMRDAVAKGRHYPTRVTACKAGHAFDRTDARGRRVCSTCKRIRKQTREQAK